MINEEKVMAQLTEIDLISKRGAEADSVVNVWMSKRDAIETLQRIASQLDGEGDEVNFSFFASRLPN